LWRPELRVGLCPDRLVSVRYARGIPRRIEEKRLIALEEREAVAPWTNAVAALKALAVEKANHTAHLSVVLSGRFVRFAVLPWTKTLASGAERLAYARHTFAATFGASASAWRVRLCETGRKRPWLACAVDEALIEALRPLRKGPGARLVSIEPYLMSAFNAHRRAFGAEPVWFVLDEPHCVIFSLIAKGAWQAVRTRHSKNDSPDALAHLLNRESALIGTGSVSDRVLICSGSDRSDVLGRLGGYRVSDVTLAQGMALELRPYAMALSA